MIEIIRLIIVGYFIVCFGSFLYNIYISRKYVKDFFGEPPISKTLFILGKICSSLIWSAIIIQLFGINLKMIKVLGARILMGSSSLQVYIGSVDIRFI